MTSSSAAFTSTKSCLSAILSRLLCSGTIPTHPSDHDHFNHPTKQVSAAAPAPTPPGIVARLMGLDSFQIMPPAHLPEVGGRKSSSGPYFRSMSVNSIDFLSFLDHPIPRKQQAYSRCTCNHRRVRTCVSFQEFQAADYLLHDDHDDDDKFRVVFPLEEEDRQDHELLVMRMSKNDNCKERRRVGSDEISDGKKRDTKLKIIPTEGKRSTMTNQKKDFHEKASMDSKLGRNTSKTAGDYKERRPIIKNHIVKKTRSPDQSTRSKEVSLEKCSNYKQGTISEKASFRSPNRKSGPRSDNEEICRADVRGDEREERKQKKERRLYYKIRYLTEEIADHGIGFEYWMYAQNLKLEEELEEVRRHLVKHVLEELLNQIVDDLLLFL